jgi:hypothetical protein
LVTSTTNLTFLTDPQTEAFAFHQLLHHKTTLLKDETELLMSSKQIVEHLITLMVTIASEGFDIPVEKKFEVSRNNLPINIYLNAS